ncbi:hypothetical protein P7C70_g698, partial [Phenoliferia sp. Uapishka_3]
MYLVMAILWLFAAAVEIYGIGAVWSQRITLVRSYFYATAVAALVVTTAELLRIIVHFADKSSIISTCVADELASNDGIDDITSESVVRPGHQALALERNKLTVFVLSQASSYCTSSWNNGTWWDIGLLIVTALVSFFFASLVASYLHQLVNPSTLRQQTAALAPSSAYSYPLAPYNGPPGGFVPPPVYAPPPGGPPGYVPQYEGEGYAKDEKDPFADATTPTSAAGPYGVSPGVGSHFERREHESESTDTVTLEPRRENEGRV